MQLFKNLLLICLSSIIFNGAYCAPVENDLEVQKELEAQANPTEPVSLVFTFSKGTPSEQISKVRTYVKDDLKGQIVTDIGGYLLSIIVANLSPEELAAIVKASGLTNAQLLQLFQDVNSIQTPMTVAMNNPVYIEATNSTQAYYLQ